MNHPDQRYILGFPEMDTQHEYCYRLFDAIVPAAASGDRARMGALLHEIEHYLMFHFECEEHLMRMYGVPSFANHQSDHEHAARRLIRFLDDFEAGTLQPAALRIFLAGWLMEHSAMSDSEYVEWILRCRKSAVEELGDR